MGFGESIQLGFAAAFEPVNLAVCLFGVTIGTLVGALPGIGAITAMSILLPVTYYMQPTAAVIMLGGIYYGAQYGGSIASILLNLPGTSTNAVTCLDGYPMTKQGRAGVALFITTITSFVGGSFAILLMMFTATATAELAMHFRAPEYFTLLLFALVAGSALSTGSALKGLTMMTVGVALGMVGIDRTSGTGRFQFGILDLSDGLNFVAVAMGLFGVAEILLNLMRQSSMPATVQAVALRSMIPTRDDCRRSVMPTVRGMLIGVVCGILPGAGPTLASFMSYATEKRVARQPERFGKGAIEGIAGPEASNNACAQSSFIPTMSLGIPGDPVMVVVLGALLLHGIAPGPSLIVEHPTLFWGLIASFWIGNVVLLILNLPLIGLWVSVLRIPYSALYPAMLFFICIGVYSINYNVFDILVVIAFGVLGVVMMVLQFPAAPLLLGFILGPMLEETFRRALLVARGDLMILVASPLSASFVAATALVLLFSLRPVAAIVAGRRTRLDPGHATHR